MITIEEERTLLERILTSDVIGFVVQGDDGKLMQCIDADPELRLALSEWKTQRIREMDRSQRQVQTDAYPYLEESYSPDMDRRSGRRR